MEYEEDLKNDKESNNDRMHKLDNKIYRLLEEKTHFKNLNNENGVLKYEIQN